MRTSSKDRVLQQFKVSVSSQLLDFLISQNVRKSRSAVKSLLSHKQIVVNGKLVTQFDFNLNKGDKVEIMRVDQTRKEKKLKGLKIVFEDDYLLVIDKEAGYLSVSTDKEKFRTVYNSLNEYVKNKKRDARVFVLHRLDREESGLMIFAKDMDVQTAFQRNWNLLVLQHTHLAVLEGELEPKEGTIHSWLTENSNYVMFSSPRDNGGLEAITHYQTIRSNGRFSLVRFNQETKRKNQIRAQVQFLEAPIVGDKKYGSKVNPLKRIALHAEYMELKHPISGRRMEFKSPLSKPMTQLVNPRNTQETNE